MWALNMLWFPVGNQKRIKMLILHRHDNTCSQSMRREIKPQQNIQIVSTQKYHRFSKQNMWYDNTSFQENSFGSMYTGESRCQKAHIHR